MSIHDIDDTIDIVEAEHIEIEEGKSNDSTAFNEEKEDNSIEKKENNRGKIDDTPYVAVAEETTEDQDKIDQEVNIADQNIVNQKADFVDQSNVSHNAIKENDLQITNARFTFSKCLQVPQGSGCYSTIKLYGSPTPFPFIEERLRDSRHSGMAIEHSGDRYIVTAGEVHMQGLPINFRVLGFLDLKCEDKLFIILMDSSFLFQPVVENKLFNGLNFFKYGDPFEKCERLITIVPVSIIFDFQSMPKKSSDPMSNEVKSQHWFRIGNIIQHDQNLTTVNLLVACILILYKCLCVCGVCVCICMCLCVCVCVRMHINSICHVHFTGLRAFAM